MQKNKEKESLNSFEKFLLKKGKNQEKIEIAANMLKKGTNIEFISEVTGLKISDVEELNKNIT